MKVIDLIKELKEVDWDNKVLFSVVINDIYYQLEFDKVDTIGDDDSFELLTFINLKE